MGVDISGYSNASMAHVLGDDIHLDSRFPGGGGVLVAVAVWLTFAAYPVAISI